MMGSLKLTKPWGPPWYLILMIVVQTMIGSGKALTPNEVNVKLQAAQALLGRQDLVKVNSDIEIMFGPLPPPGQADHKGIYNRFFQAYHFNVYGTRLWDKGNTWVTWWTEQITNIRRTQYSWIDFLNSMDLCKHEVAAFLAAGAAATDSMLFVESCSFVEKKMTGDGPYKFELNLRKSFVYGVHLTSMAHVLACNLGLADGATAVYAFNGQTTDKLAENPDVTLYGRMNKEYKSLGDDIDRLLKMLSQTDPNAATQIEIELKKPPFKTLYMPDESKRKDFFDKFEEHFIFTHCAELSRELQSIYIVDDAAFLAEFGNAINSNLDYVNGTPGQGFNLWNDTVDAFGLVKYFYETSLTIEPLPPNDLRRKDFITWDGKWDWKIDGPDDLNIIHRARLGTDLLDSVVENLKCHLNETFDRAKRDAMIKAYSEMVDWSTAKLYLGISPTLTRPCITANDSDLIGTCTKENHEICIPSYYDTEKQDPLNEAKGGLSLMKPKWHFRRVNKNGECKGVRTYITHYKICQCGFRMDCGSDLGTQITCQFVENDLIRKQCRGSVAYPCKTHPLAPGEYARSCVTGYCDESENSCEKHHWRVYE